MGASRLGLLSLLSALTLAVGQFCLPTQWQSGYTRTRDNSAGIGNVTHDYHRLLLGSEEHAVGNFGGHELSWSVKFYMNDTIAYTALTFQGGFQRCFKLPNMTLYDYEVHCYPNPINSKGDSYNDRPIKLGIDYHTTNFTNLRAHVMVAEDAPNHLPLQWYIFSTAIPSKTNNASRVPDVALYHDGIPSANERLFGIPEVCKKVDVEEGPLAERVVRNVYGNLVGRPVSSPDDNSYILEVLEGQQQENTAPTSPFATAHQSKGEEDRFCLPAQWNSVFYANNDDYTITGNVTHNYAKREFGVDENLNNPLVNLKIRFIQKGSLAWSIVKNYTGATTCKHATVQQQYDIPCRQAMSTPINVNGKPAKELNFNSTTPSGGVTYSSFYQSLDGLPLGALNYTQGGSCTNGCPFALGFFNAQATTRQSILEVPSICPTEPSEEHSEEVNKMSHHYANHEINNLL